MKYELHLRPEALWGLAFAVLTFVGQAAQSADIGATAEDPEAWLLAVGVGVLRIIVGAVLPGANSVR